MALISIFAGTGEAVHVGKVETSDGSKQSACEHNPARSPQIIQSPPYQTPDDDSANDVAEYSHSSVVAAIGGGVGISCCGAVGSGPAMCAGRGLLLVTHGFLPYRLDRCRSGGGPY